MSDAHWKIGANYLIRTATMIDAGKLVAVTEHELVLEDASWIADTGRFGKALEKWTFNEVEMFPAGQVIVGRGSLIAAVQILPRCPQRRSKSAFRHRRPKTAGVGLGEQRFNTSTTDGH